MIEKTKKSPVSSGIPTAVDSNVFDVVMEKAEGIEPAEAWVCVSNWSVSWRPMKARRNAKTGR